jgi:hypothetical protein
MTSIWRSLTSGRSLLALGVGLVLFGGLSILRIRLQYALPLGATLGFALTVLMYLIPGALVGLLVLESRLLHGAILGLLTILVVWFETPLQRASLPWIGITKFLAFLGLFGVVVSAAGSLGASWTVQRVTSNNRWRGS